MDIGKIIGAIINLGLILAAAGLLYVATDYLREEARMTQKQGVVSLGAFNRRLQSGR